MAEQKATTKKKTAANKELKSIYFQDPAELCDFVNKSAIEVVTITAFDRFQALYYHKK